MVFKGNDARKLLAAMTTSDQLTASSKNEMLAPEMKDAVLSEMVSRDLIEGNYQI